MNRREMIEKAMDKGYGTIDGDDAAAVFALIQAARRVVATWDAGDLAGAVQELDAALAGLEGSLAPEAIDELADYVANLIESPEDAEAVARSIMAFAQTWRASVADPISGVTNVRGIRKGVTP